MNNWIAFSALLVSIFLFGASVALWWIIRQEYKSIQAQKRQLIETQENIKKQQDFMIKQATRFRHQMGVYTKIEWLVEDDGTIDIFKNQQPKDIKGKSDYLFNLAFNKLGGWCSYRKLYQELKDYNQEMKEAGQDKLVISQHYIRDTLDECTFDPTKRPGGPLIVVWDDEEDNYEYFILTYDKGQGGATKRLVSLGELANTWKEVRQNG